MNIAKGLATATLFGLPMLAWIASVPSQMAFLTSFQLVKPVKTEWVVVTWFLYGKMSGLLFHNDVLSASK